MPESLAFSQRQRSTLDATTLRRPSSTSTLSSSSLLSTVTPVFLPFIALQKIDLLSEEPTLAGSEILGWVAEMLPSSSLLSSLSLLVSLPSSLVENLEVEFLFLVFCLVQCYLTRTRPEVLASVSCRFPDLSLLMGFYLSWQVRFNIFNIK